jgi:ribosomal protein S18 acetylase RimI-like enzyme
MEYEMGFLLRRSEPGDFQFLRQMLYEAVYWKSIAQGTNPPFEEGLSKPGIANALKNWGERNGDTGVIAMIDLIPVGAAWYRFYSSENSIRGYIDDEVPALVVAVHNDQRRAGIGDKLMNRLINEASHQKIGMMSLMVTNDNIANRLYEKCGFKGYENIGNSVLMTRTIQYQPEASRP